MDVNLFFILNKDIILFVYGLGFFILGFAILLQAQQSSRLELARSLRWLAAFGITHAFNEWGDLFIPIQAQYLRPGMIRLLEVIQLILLAVSFAALFEFGISVLPSSTAKARAWIPGPYWQRGRFLFFLFCCHSSPTWRRGIIREAHYLATLFVFREGFWRPMDCDCMP
jgi:hypothetical protein